MCCSPFFPCPSYNLAWTNQDPLLKMLKMSVCSGFATVSEVGLDPKDLVIACTVYWPRQSHFISAQAERGSKKEKKLKLSVIRKVDPVASSGSDFRERVPFPIPVYIQGSRIFLLPLLFNLIYPSISEERRVDTNGSGPLRLPSSTCPWRSSTSEGIVHTDKFKRARIPCPVSSIFPPSLRRGSAELRIRGDLQCRRADSSFLFPLLLVYEP
jgi:hypothetical protein